MPCGAGGPVSRVESMLFPVATAGAGGADYWRWLAGGDGIGGEAVAGVLRLAGGEGDSQCCTCVAHQPG